MRTRVMFGVVLLALLSACSPIPSSSSPSSSSDPAPQPSLSPQRMLRVHGSNTIGSKLAPALAEAFLGEEGATDVRREAGNDPVEVAVLGTLPNETRPTRIEIEARGTSTAFSSLQTDQADIGMASRRVKPAERDELLPRVGDLTSAASEHIVALDGVAIITHTGNGVESLTVDQLQSIFTCQVTDWSAVGGSPGPITLYARDDQSGTFDTFSGLVLRRQELCASAQRFEDSSELSREVAADTSAIGFVALPFVGTNKAVQVSSGSSTPIAPSADSIATERYVLSRRLYFYLPKSPTDIAERFKDFALSVKGQAVVAEVGFVAQPGGPVAQPEPPCDTPPEYCEFIRGAQRASFEIHFDSGTDRLDNKASADIVRLVQFIRDPAQQNRQVLLAGFADNVGSDAANLALSQARAAAATGQLTAEGIQAAGVSGFGEARPIDSNDTEEGRAKNRRVEVWLR